MDICSQYTDNNSMYSSLLVRDICIQKLHQILVIGVFGTRNLTIYCLIKGIYLW